MVIIGLFYLRTKLKMKLTDFLREDSPYSSMRLSILIIQLLFLPAFAIVWSIISLKTGVVQEIPQGILWIIGLTLGMKTIQKKFESDNQNNKSEQKTN
jgi:glucan phosphoethanolaminetransferase (alkaline phosphatase superfamily)